MIIVSMVITGCGDDRKALPTTAAPTIPQSPSRTQTLISTPTRIKSPTLTPTPQPSPTPYPTFDVAYITTNTPSSRAVCPYSNPNRKVHFGLSGNNIDWIQLPYIVLNEVDAGASYDAVVKAFNNEMGGKNRIYTKDLTGDGIKELVVPALLDLLIIGCKDGENVILTGYTAAGGGGTSSPEIIYVGDMNLDGTPEVVIAYPATTGWNTTVDIVQWNGEDLISLIAANHGFDSIQTSRLAQTLYWYEQDWKAWEPESDGEWWDIPSANGQGDVTVQDINGDRTKELILRDYGPSHLDTLLSYGPWRGKKATFQWDGIHFLYSALEIDPPRYRFQALQDADRQFLLGNYDEAVSLYQDVISSDTLEGWSPDNTRYEIQSYDAKYNEGPTPLPPSIDPAEYPSLSAYARFRLMLLHTSRGWKPEAQLALEDLRSEFAGNPYGAPYVEAAELFWQSFQDKDDLAIACSKVVGYFSENPELLVPLGNGDHGMQSHNYEPEDTCPSP